MVINVGSNFQYPVTLNDSINDIIKVIFPKIFPPYSNVCIYHTVENF